MSNELRTISPDIISKLVIGGDLRGLTPGQKVEFYNYRCSQAGLDPAAKPFDLLVLNGKEILYANAGATQQLTANRNLSHSITGRDLTDGIYCVFCKVTDPEGRSTENMGAVPIEGLKGEAKANAMLKATTKAIRRSVLAHCGLGLMDEVEVDTIPILPPIEWTDGEVKEAAISIGAAGDKLIEWGLDEAQTADLLKSSKDNVRNPEMSFETWGNRLFSQVERWEKKYKPVEEVKA